MITEKLGEYPTKDVIVTWWKDYKAEGTMYR